MTFSLTLPARNAAEAPNKEPLIVLEIDGVSTIYGLGTIKETIKYGCPGLTYNQIGIIYGGLKAVDDQKDYISFDGTTTQLKQQLEPFRGAGTSIQTYKVALIDKNNEISNLVSRGQVVTDILGRKCKVYLGFRDTAWKDDFIRIFKGIILNYVSAPGLITFTLSHPEDKKRQQIFVKSETELNGAIGSGDTSLIVDSAANFLQKVAGPTGGFDADISFYLRIEDEIIEYDSITTNTFNSLTRGSLGTIAAAHDNNSAVESFYRFVGNPMDLSLKLMLSTSGNDISGVEITNFNVIPPAVVSADTIFFLDVDVENEFGIVIGDFITTVGAANGANNVTLKAISNIVKADGGSFIIIDGVTFVVEENTSATISFRSKYDVWPAGLGMTTDDVDVAEHERLFSLFLSSFEYDIYIKDTIDGKEFIEKEFYSPIACYSVPRKTRASVSYHIGPIPGEDIPIIDDTIVTNPSKIKFNRSINKNFYNTIIYKFDEDPLEDKFFRGTINTDATSVNEIPIGTRALTIISKGLRSTSQGVTTAQQSASRRLFRYAFGAEFFTISLFYGDGYSLEIGDIVLFDGSKLQITNTRAGNRIPESRLYEITNKSLDIKTGQIDIEITDTAFDLDSRYALISATSLVKTSNTTSEFVIEAFGAAEFGPDEFRQWEKFESTELVFKVRTQDFVNESDSRAEFLGNSVTLDTPASFLPAPPDLFELTDYIQQGENIKLIYGFMTPSSDVTFGDGSPAYLML